MGEMIIRRLARTLRRSAKAEYTYRRNQQLAKAEELMKRADELTAGGGYEDGRKAAGIRMAVRKLGLTKR